MEKIFFLWALFVIEEDIATLREGDYLTTEHVNVNELFVMVDN